MLSHRKAFEDVPRARWLSRARPGAPGQWMTPVAVSADGDASLGLLSAAPLAAVEDMAHDRAEAAELQPDPLPRAARWFKRTFDVTLGLLGLVLAFPVLLLAAVAIKLDSPGPVLFHQTRVGASGRRFRIHKLRSMVVDNDDSEHRAYVAALIRGEAGTHGGMFKLVRDPRVTRVGRLLRRLSLDEVPQLWNVVRGEMSLVGPRPPLPNEVALYDERAQQRLRIRPGLTGLAQIHGRCELTFDEMVTKDIEYWRSWNLMLELKILLKTPAAVFSKRGAA